MFAAIVLPIIILDLLWLGLIARGVYQGVLSAFLRPHFSLLGAFVVYVALALGVQFFVLRNSFVVSSKSSLLMGALFGLLVYAVYEFTNLAVIGEWSLKVVFIDIVWGVIMMSLSSLAGFRAQAWAS